jgi:hypothetical protein
MSVMRDVRFIQYVRPFGRRREMFIERPEEIASAPTLSFGSRANQSGRRALC